MKKILAACRLTVDRAVATLFALLLLAGTFSFAANYTATQGSGLTFGSIVVGGINYAQQFICDLATPSQCAAVSSGGAVSVGAASGAFASGSGADGWDVSEGATSAAAATVGSTGSVNAKLRLMTTQIDTLNTNVTSAVPAGTNLIGKVGIDQTTPGTTNLVALGANQSVNQTQIGGTAVVADPCQQVAHVLTRVDIASAASSVLVAGTSSKKTYICSMMLFAAGTTNVGIVEGSGSTCGTSPLGLIGGNTAAKGPNLTAQVGFVAGTGTSAIAGTTVNANDICLINSAAIQVSGYIVTATP